MGCGASSTVRWDLSDPMREALAECAAAEAEAPCTGCPPPGVQRRPARAAAPETWDEGASFHCAKCKTAFASERRQAAERHAMEVVAAEDARAAPPTEAEREEAMVQRGVSVQWLRTFAAAYPGVRMAGP